VWLGRPALRIPQGENEIMRRLIQFALLVLLCIATATLASAQGLDGTLRVTVTDASGASVESATVKVINEATNLSVSSNTSSAGTYVFPNLKIGTYSISVEKDGFKKSIQKGVTVASNQVAEAKVLLEIGSVSAVVEVEAGSDLIKTTTSELSTTIDGRITNTLPVNTLGRLDWRHAAPVQRIHYRWCRRQQN
jgi:carboxypeptidase family protein